MVIPVDFDIEGDQMAEKYLIIINNAPYGDERPFNALRLAMNLVKRENTDVRVFLTADGVSCARRGQKTPDGYYNIERMIKAVALRGKVATWQSCCDARGFGLDDLAEGVEMGSLVLMADWTVEVDKVLIF